MNAAVWFAHHELRLAWRDLVAMLTAGKRGRERIVVLAILAFALFLHGFAWKVVAPYAQVTFPPDRETLLVVTGSAFLSWTLMMSQAMESATRAFYARSDLDLLMSSPAPTRAIFALRIGAIALTTCALAVMLIGPFIDVLAWTGGVHWLAAYGVLLAMAAAATALAVGLTVFLFGTLGPRRTRFIAQVVAAIVGAVFVIGVQAVSIFTYGNLSRLDAFRSETVMNLAPGLDSPAWLPARAAMGDGGALLIVLVVSFGLLAIAVAMASKRFGLYATAAAGVAMGTVRQKRRLIFRRASPAMALRRKEWTLLARDPWLVSQTLMQILYLIPPGLLLWRNFGKESGALVMLAPVLVMAAGQLAGGLAWLAISGEDAPDLVSTAPVSWNVIARAKIEAVISSVAVVLAPVILALAIASAWTALIASLGILAAAASATAIQMFFRAQAKRSNFRRRQTSSRAATFAEALSSIGWAATAGLAAAGDQLAVSAAAVALLVVMVARLISPRPTGA